jgi:hypothetical protein
MTQGLGNLTGAQLGQRLGEPSQPSGEACPGVANNRIVGCDTLQPRAQVPELSVPTPPEQPQRPPTLDEFAAGYRVTAIDVQRQNDAFAYFRRVVQQLETRAQNPAAEIGDLPFVTFHYAVSEGNKPGEYKLDLNTLAPELQVQFHPLFAMIASDVAERLMQAWDAGHEITQGAQQIIRQARSRQVP